MAFLRLLKYSSVVFLFRRYRFRLFRIVAAILFALVTSLLYTDVQDYLALRHPGAVVYALLAKIIIVYGALVFVLWQFRPVPEKRERLGDTTRQAPPPGGEGGAAEPAPPADRLARLEDLERRDSLRSRYNAMLEQRRGKPPE